MPADMYVLRDLDKYPIQGSIDRAKTLDLLPPQFAKLSFQPKAQCGCDGPVAERMWVKIMYVNKKDGKITYGGTLNNEPGNFHPNHLRWGEIVEFQPNHIIDVYDGDALEADDPRKNVVKVGANTVRAPEKEVRVFRVRGTIRRLD